MVAASGIVNTGQAWVHGIAKGVVVVVPHARGEGQVRHRSIFVLSVKRRAPGVGIDVQVIGTGRYVKVLHHLAEVITILGADGDGVLPARLPVQLQLAADGFRNTLIPVDDDLLRLAGFRHVVGVLPPILVPVVVQTRLQLHTFRERMFVPTFQQPAPVVRAARHSEHRPVRRTRRVFIPPDVGGVDGQPPLPNACVDAAGGFAIAIMYHAVACLRAVVFREVDMRIAVTREAASGDEHFHPIGHSGSIGQTTPVGVVRTRLTGRLDAADLLRPFRQDIDHSENRVVPIERGPRSADDLDPVDQVHVEDEIVHDGRRVVQRVVHPMSVQEQQDSSAEIPRSTESANADEAVRPGIGHVETGRAPQKVAERAPAVGPDVLSGEHRHRRRRLRCLLFALRCRSDGYGHQLFETHFGIVHLIGFLGPRRQDRQKRRDDGQTEPATPNRRRAFTRGLHRLIQPYVVQSLHHPLSPKSEAFGGLDAERPPVLFDRMSWRAPSSPDSDIQGYSIGLILAHRHQILDSLETMFANRSSFNYPQQQPANMRRVR